MKAQHGQEPWTLREVNQASVRPARRLTMSSPTAADFAVSVAMVYMMLSLPGCVRAEPPIPPEAGPQDRGPVLIPTSTPRPTVIYAVDRGNATENVTWGQYLAGELKSLGCSAEKLEKRIIPEPCLTFYRARDRGKIPVKANMSDYNRTSEIQDYADEWLKDSFNHDQRRMAKQKVAEVLDPENSTFTHKLYKEAVDRWIERATDNGEDLSKTNLERAKTEIEEKNARIANHYREYIPTGNINDLTEDQMMRLISVVQKDFFGEEYEFELLDEESFKMRMMDLHKMKSWDEVRVLYAGGEPTAFTYRKGIVIMKGGDNTELMQKIGHESAHCYMDKHTQLGRLYSKLCYDSLEKCKVLRNGCIRFYEGFAEYTAERIKRSLEIDRVHLTVCKESKAYCEGRDRFGKLEPWGVKDVDRSLANMLRPAHGPLDETSFFNAAAEGRVDEYLKNVKSP